MKIDKRYTSIAIIVALIGALFLAFGDKIGLVDLARGTISGFVLAIAADLLPMGYDVAKNKRAEEDKRKGNFLAIYLEILLVS
ncbi:hypothetical protein ACFLWZ_04775 [Chloroflexota bacterium]